MHCRGQADSQVQAHYAEVKLVSLPCPVCKQVLQHSCQIIATGLTACVRIELVCVGTVCQHGAGGARPDAAVAKLSF